MTPGQLHLAVSQRLRASRLRYTWSRRVLIDTLRRRGPATVTELLTGEPALHLSTTYRSLAVLEHIGVVVRLPAPLGIEARFELTEPYTAHHHHLVCTRCGAMDDYILPDDIEDALERVASRAAETAGFDVDTRRLDFVGVCRSCS